MRKNFLTFLSILILLLLGFKVSTMNIYNNNYKIDLQDKNKKASVILKGLKDSKDFIEDGQGNLYVAFKNRVQYINIKGESYDIINNKSINIYSIEYYKNSIYYASNNSIYSYNTIDKKTKELINNIPNSGDYKDLKLKVYDGILYAAIGAATNSGVVGPDNVWLKDNPFIYDMSPKKIILKGQNFQSNKTGAFSPYNTSNVKGQIISEHFPGNSSIIAINLKTKNAKTFAYGIRNVKGMDTTSKGILVGTVGGMEDRGLRPVKGDSDYVFNIESGKWYGFPDYSGGDPIDSPKFSKGVKSKLSFILDKQPTTNPPAPIYESKYVASLGALAVDKEGCIGEKDSIYFYDNKEKTINFLDDQGVCRKVASFNNESNITSLKFNKNELLVLDSRNGTLSSISSVSIDKNSSGNNIMIYIMFSGITISIVVILVLEKIKINKTRW